MRWVTDAVRTFCDLVHHLLNTQTKINLHAVINALRMINLSWFPVWCFSELFPHHIANSSRERERKNTFSLLGQPKCQIGARLSDSTTCTIEEIAWRDDWSKRERIGCCTSAPLAEQLHLLSQQKLEIANRSTMIHGVIAGEIKTIGELDRARYQGIP